MRTPTRVTFHLVSGHGLTQRCFLKSGRHCPPLLVWARNNCIHAVTTLISFNEIYVKVGLRLGGANEISLPADVSPRNESNQNFRMYFVRHLCDPSNRGYTLAKKVTSLT